MDNGYVEYCVKKKKEGTFKLISVLWYAFFSLVPLICVLALFFLGQPELLLGGVAAVGGIFGIGGYLTHKYLSVEYEYVIVGGEMTVDVIYGGRSRKTVEEIELKDAKLCLPFNEENQRVISEASYEKLLDISSRRGSDSAWLLLWEKDGKRKALLFDTDERVTDMLRRSCRAAVTGRLCP